MIAQGQLERKTNDDSKKGKNAKIWTSGNDSEQKLLATTKNSKRINYFVDKFVRKLYRNKTKRGGQEEIRNTHEDQKEVPKSTRHGIGGVTCSTIY